MGCTMFTVPIDQLKEAIKEKAGLSDEQVAKLKIGDLLNDDVQNPLIYKK